MICKMVAHRRLVAIRRKGYNVLGLPTKCHAYHISTARLRTFEALQWTTQRRWYSVCLCYYSGLHNAGSTACVSVTTVDYTTHVVQRVSLLVQWTTQRRWYSVCLYYYSGPHNACGTACVSVSTVDYTTHVVQHVSLLVQWTTQRRWYSVCLC